MKYLIIPITILISQHAFTQSPVITRDNYFDIGDSVLLYLKFDTSLWSASVGAAGENVIWDFSAMDFDHPSVIVDTLLFIDPEGTPFYPTSMSADYSAANLSVLRRSEEFSPENNDYSYYHINDDSLAFLGHWADNGGTELWEDQYPDPLRELIFPLSYLDTFEDDFINSYVDQSGSGLHVRSGTHSVTVDGYGTMISPDGTVLSDVIRIHEVTTMIDSSMFGEESQTLEKYSWYAAGVKGAVLQLNIAVWDPGTVETARYQRQTNISTSVGTVGHSDPAIVPNPVRDHFTIKAITPIALVEVFNAAGELIERVPANGTTITIGRKRASAGVYMIRITSADGIVSRSKIVLE